MTKQAGYGQYCPIAVTAEYLAKPWTPLVLRALCMGATRYSEIRESVPRMSTALLSSRLDELEHAQIITRRKAPTGRGHVYRLTRSGEELFPVLEAMGFWAQKWLRHEITRAENLDPFLLMWEIRRAARAAPRDGAGRRVVHFRLGGVAPEKRHYWLVFEPGDVDICTRDPGHEVDLWVAGDVRDLVETWLGHRDLDRTLEERRLAVDGSPDELRAFRDWFVLSRMAQAAG